MKYSKSTISEIAKIKNGKKTKVRNYTEGKYLVFGSNGVLGKHQEKNAPFDSIIIGRVGANAGSVMFSTKDHWVSDNAISVIPNTKKVNPYYLFYTLKSLRLNEFTSGSAQPLINQVILNSFKLKLIDRNNQNKVGKILWNLDSKIELNNQIINTLEEIATTLFNHWFIDFEFPDKKGNPYKSSGGKMIESELGEIPEGWEVKNLGDLVTFEYGKALKKENRLNGKYPVYGSGGVVGYHNEYLINGPSIIVGRKGTVGSIYYSEENSFPIDTTFWIKPKLENLSMGFTLLILKNQDFSNLISDSAIPGLNRNVAYQNKVIFPAEKIMLEFNAINNSLLKNINSLKKENETLKELRDTLLPKLLSGEIELE